jgi:flagellar biosynthetic protein FlhB
VSDQQQRTEQATPQRLEKARKQGDVARSRELMAAMAMLAGALALGAAAKAFVPAWRLGFAQMLAASADEVAATQLLRLLLPPLMPVGLVLAAAFTAALLCGVAQSGGLSIHPNALQMKLERLNPATNLGHMFSARSVTRLGKSLLPAGVMVWFGAQAVKGLLGGMPVMSLARLPAMLAVSYALMLKADTVMMAWAGVDYAMERRAWSQRLRMSKQEMREEAKEQQGNPQVRQRLRTIQRAMSKRKQRADVSRASVVITNPTHYAVALEFSFETMQAPVLLAKGKNLIAAEIREEARWAGVPIIENPPLARSIYRSVEPGQAIPYELYATVAGILAYLYRQEVKKRQGTEKKQGTGIREQGTGRTTASTLNVPLRAPLDMRGF